MIMNKKSILAYAVEIAEKNGVEVGPMCKKLIERYSELGDSFENARDHSAFKAEAELES